MLGLEIGPKCCHICILKFFDCRSETLHPPREPPKNWRTGLAASLNQVCQGGSKPGFIYIPRILWTLLVYTVPITTVESMDRKISSYLRRWLVYLAVEAVCFQLKFHPQITSTRLRPDMSIISDSTKQQIILELTMPWEERIDEAH